MTGGRLARAAHRGDFFGACAITPQSANQHKRPALESPTSRSRNPNAPPLGLLLGGDGQVEGELTTDFNGLDSPSSFI
jgi:hypothetical protein